tara:strand:- start:659 stop:850 length:192 start_codon:yes stop_codon:yes gene_type:complete
MHPDVIVTLYDLDKTEWLHQKSLELIKKGFDSDEAYIIACKLMGKAKGVTTQLDLDSDKQEKK